MDSRTLRKYIALREKLSHVAKAELSEASESLRQSQEHLISAEVALEKASQDLSSSQEISVADLELQTDLIRDADKARIRAAEQAKEAEARKNVCQENMKLREQERRGLELVEERVSRVELKSLEKIQARIDDDRSSTVHQKIAVARLRAGSKA